MKLCGKVTEFAPGKESSERVLKLNLEEIDDTAAVVVIRMRKDRTVETSWSRCVISDVAYMERCFGADVLDLINANKYE